DALSAGGLAEDGHVRWIAAKGGDIVLNPRQRQLLVHEPIVAVFMTFGIDRALSEESQIAEAVVEGDDDDALFYEPLRVVRSAGSFNEAAAVNPNHHRQTGAARSGGEDVQEQAILVAASCLRA